MSLFPGGAPPKPTKPIKNPGLRKHIHSKPCCVCGNPGTPYNRIVCHHIDTGGMGTSGPDEDNMLPVHYIGCHTGVAHSMTIARLSEKVGRNLREYAVDLTTEYNQIEASNG